MKTYLINLDGIDSEIFKNLMGFILTAGLNFRKVDQKTESGTGRTLFVELATKGEETALKAFLEKQNVTLPIIIGTANKANLAGKKLGVFSQVENPIGNYYQDKTTGKKFAIVGD